MSIYAAAFGSLLLAILPGAPARNASPITKYRIETRNETTIDLSGFGVPSQQQNFSLVSWIAVSLTDTVGGRTLHVVIDSMRYEGAIEGIGQATADSAKGATVHGLVDPNGRVSNLVSRPENVLLAEIHGVAHGFFPKVRTGAKSGDGWSDTLEVTNTANGANVKSTYSIAYTSAGQENVAGLAALKLSSVSNATLVGTIQNPAMGTMQVEGKIKASGTSFIAPDGRYLGGTSSMTGDQLLKSAMAPAPIPVKTVRTTTITVLP